MPYKEKEIEKIYWSIGEVSEMLDLSFAQIRLWEKEFDVFNLKKIKKETVILQKRILKICG